MKMQNRTNRTRRAAAAAATAIVATTTLAGATGAGDARAGRGSRRRRRPHHQRHERRRPDHHRLHGARLGRRGPRRQQRNPTLRSRQLPLGVGGPACGRRRLPDDHRRVPRRRTDDRHDRQRQRRRHRPAPGATSWTAATGKTCSWAGRGRTSWSVATGPTSSTAASAPTSRCSGTATTPQPGTRVRATTRSTAASAGTRLAFNGANGDEQMSLSANGRSAVFLRTQGNIRMDLDGVERLDLATFGGADTVTIDDLSGTEVTTAEIDLASTTGAADARDDTVQVNGSGRADRVDVAADGGAVEVTGLAARPASPAATPTDVLRINTFGGDDQVTVSRRKRVPCSTSRPTSGRTSDRSPRSRDRPSAFLDQRQTNHHQGDHHDISPCQSSPASPTSPSPSATWPAAPPGTPTSSAPRQSSTRMSRPAPSTTRCSRSAAATSSACTRTWSQGGAVRRAQPWARPRLVRLRRPCRAREVGRPTGRARRRPRRDRRRALRVGALVPRPGRHRAGVLRSAGGLTDPVRVTGETRPDCDEAGGLTSSREGRRPDGRRPFSLTERSARSRVIPPWAAALRRSGRTDTPPRTAPSG